VLCGNRRALDWLERWLARRFGRWVERGLALMSRTYRRGERRIRVRGIRRKDPDLRKLGRALIELAQAQAEADALAEHEVRNKRTVRRSRDRKRRA
jgi:hypothetical protein